MTRALLLPIMLLLTACGVQRPLIAPKDIPAYEERLRRKEQRLNDTPVTVKESPASSPQPSTPQIAN